MYISAVSINLLVIVSSLLCPAIVAQQPTYLYHFCPNTTTFSTNSTYRSNRDTVLSSLRSNGTRGNGFHRTTAGRNSDIVYGLFLCRGDLSNSVCQSCVTFAATDISRRCPVEKTAMAWYDECLIRYSEQNIFSIVTDEPGIVLRNTQNVTDPDQFNQQVLAMMNHTAIQAANVPPGAKKFETRQEATNFSLRSRTIYTLGQCTPDLSSMDCDRCLRMEITSIPLGWIGARYLNPSCNIRYEIYPFYNQTDVPAPTPQTIIVFKTEQPTFLYHNCSNTTFSTESTFKENRDVVLSSLSSNGIRENGFRNTTAGRNPDIVYGLFLCRGDLSTRACRSCVNFAAADIALRCPVETTAVVWYDECLLRYSERDIFSVMTVEPVVLLTDTEKVTDDDYPLNQEVSATANLVINDAVIQTENEPAGAKNFATRETNISSTRKLYTLVQCTPDLSQRDCSICLRVVIHSLQIRGLGGRVLTPSCSARYDIAASPPPPPEEDKQNKSNRTPVLVAILSTIFGLLVVSASGFFIWRRRNTQDKENSQEVQLLDLVSERPRETFSGENVGNSQEFPSIQLDILHAATNHFSDENKLGEGGFGPVYKGTLADGKEIAVKRLSKTSSQGLVEFKNEVMLIAKLQHRNLVRLVGCCLEQNEKLLVYEFMPNRSLDVFLFDPNLGAQLDWQKRYNIIKGIARGILYLHEDSRLRIIHRDLKASNVLLDHEMNPKISDFGMARIFVDKNEANTNRVVGTYGYMAPEYAMQGLFSIKSDVFSFGVLLIEIISGKKNNSFHLSETGESLLTFAWKLWSKGEGMDLTDQILVPSCVASEVLKCIHIGILCVQEDPADRPTMSSVIFMLASHGTILFPRPAEPAFSVGRVVAKPTEYTSNDEVFSINEVTISNFSPR